jgi:hypothetical protein
MRRETPDAWRPDGTGITDGGDCGGDIQVGETAPSVRFVRPDRPRSMITVTYYPVEYGNCPGEFVVQRQVEWLVCEDPADPGGTEVWSDEARDDIGYTVMDSVEEAELVARELANLDLENGGQGCDWDGYSDPVAQYRPTGDHWACWRCGSRDCQDFTANGTAFRRCGDCELYEPAAVV